MAYYIMGICIAFAVLLYPFFRDGSGGKTTLIIVVVESVLWPLTVVALIYTAYDNHRFKTKTKSRHE